MTRIVPASLFLAFLGTAACAHHVPHPVASPPATKDDSAATRSQVLRIETQGYVDWAKHHRDATCPPSLRDVVDMVRESDHDAWGSALVMYCGDDLPPELADDLFEVASPGPDRVMGTNDDIVSWDPTRLSHAQPTR